MRTTLTYELLECVMPYIHDPKDRDTISRVCWQWYELDSRTRTHLKIAFCYTTTPNRLRRRFPYLESLKIKGKPRGHKYGMIPENWGGSVTPWVSEIAKYSNCLKYLHFRRMVVSDSDLENLARFRGHSLHALKLDDCSQFSTDGLLFIGLYCRSLRHLFMEDSVIVEKEEKSHQWLHELAVNNKVLESLNFYNTDIATVSIQDLELIAKNCPKFVSLKISSHYEILDLVNFFGYATSLEEFCGGSYDRQPEDYSSLSLPAKLNGLGLTNISRNQMKFAFPYAAQLKKLNLLFAFLKTKGHCKLYRNCPNLEVLETTNEIGDRGLEVLAQCCRKLKRLKITRARGDHDDVEDDDDDDDDDDDGGGGGDDDGDEEREVVSQRGLIALSHGCPNLEYLAVYVIDITNESLQQMGTHLKNLCDFRLVLQDRKEKIPDLPLDNGVRALLRGCEKLRRFALCLRPGGLTDVGLGYIGQYSRNVRWMLLRYVGESDEGLLEFSRGCPSLQKLEMLRCSFFTQNALAIAATRLTSLRYLWVGEYRPSISRDDLKKMARPYWNIEVSPRGFGHQIFGYYSLAGRRSDFPDTVKLL